MQDNHEQDKSTESVEDILQDMDSQGILKEMLSEGDSMLEIITADKVYHVDIVEQEKKE